MYLTLSLLTELYFFGMCSFTAGVEGVDEEGRLLGGFQDVASLLNCLSGQISSLSPISRPHSHTTPTKQDALFSISVTKQITKCTSTPTEGRSESGERQQDICSSHRANTTGMQADILHRKCNSLPRPRVAKIFVNNLHDFTRDGATCQAEKNYHSLRRQKSLTNGRLLEGECRGTKQISGQDSHPALGYKENALFGKPGMGRKCVACTVHRQSQDKVSVAPRRCRSSTTVSYIISSSPPDPPAQCQCSGSEAGFTQALFPPSCDQTNASNILHSAFSGLEDNYESQSSKSSLRTEDEGRKTKDSCAAGTDLRHGQEGSGMRVFSERQSFPASTTSVSITPQIAIISCQSNTDSNSGKHYLL